jgi:hypothetical protein
MAFEHAEGIELTHAVLVIIEYRDLHEAPGSIWFSSRRSNDKALREDARGSGKMAQRSILRYANPSRKQGVTEQFPLYLSATFYSKFAPNR